MNLSEIWNDLSEIDTVPKIFAIFVIFGLAIVAIHGYDFRGDELYPKRLHPESHLYPYDRGGEPLESFADLENFVQYPDHMPSLGWITGYLTPLTTWLADRTPFFGTTIVSHPGGIMDEILYYTRGLDTVLESSILLMGFLIATYLMIGERRKKGGGRNV